ncbi:MAG TPA: fumarylacetoacetate hydrolase family protein [Pseudonocardiaceae bacterium]|jgi:2-keto-4-pentenoate hydratase/2-oxohepta-3-ene-1,7-dioic acid hydratase in catechol pathway|nr:fumarylacetoacetate hydrolase family protein [Pseudonocardiaceae bacterium]
MRFVTYQHDGRAELGVRTTEGIVATGYPDLREYLAAGESATTALQRLLASGPATVQPDRMLSPIPDRAQLICVGGNYSDHLAEAGLAPTEPVYFPKVWSALLPPGPPLRMPEPTSLLDYEVELAIVIGRTARHIAAADYLDYVLGYTVVNDISARDVMIREHMQIMLCKSADGFLPIAEEIVTADEVDLTDNALTCTVNGELRQKSTVDQMLYRIPHLLELLTRYVTLSPGDLVTTGSPGGSAMGRGPSAYLGPGDVVIASVEGVTSVTTTVAEALA